MFYDAKEVAAEYFQGKLSYRQVLNLTHNGILPAVKQGRTYLYDSESLDNWRRKNFNIPVSDDNIAGT